MLVLHKSAAADHTVVCDQVGRNHVRVALPSEYKETSVMAPVTITDVARAWLTQAVCRYDESRKGDKGRLEDEFLSVVKKNGSYALEPVSKTYVNAFDECSRWGSGIHPHLEPRPLSMDHPAAKDDREGTPRGMRHGVFASRKIPADTIVATYMPGSHVHLSSEEDEHTYVDGRLLPDIHMYRYTMDLPPRSVVLGEEKYLVVLGNPLTCAATLINDYRNIKPRNNCISYLVLRVRRRARKSGKKQQKHQQQQKQYQNLDMNVVYSVEPMVVVVTTKAISEGEELLQDYSDVYWEVMSELLLERRPESEKKLDLEHEIVQLAARQEQELASLLNKTFYDNKPVELHRSREIELFIARQRDRELNEFMQRKRRREQELAEFMQQQKERDWQPHPAKVLKLRTDLHLRALEQQKDVLQGLKTELAAAVDHVPSTEAKLKAIKRKLSLHHEVSASLHEQLMLALDSPMSTK